MWEKEKQTGEQMPPVQIKKEKTNAEDSVLRMQTLFCVVILAAALLARQFLPAGFAVFSKEYLAWLESGISVTQQDKVFRFAAKQLETAALVMARLEDAFAKAAAPKEE